MLEIIYDRDARKFINKNKKIGEKIINNFDELSKDLSLLNNIKHYKKLKGSQNKWRLRVGEYRAIFEIMNSKLIIYVIKIGSRGDIYK